MYSETTNSIRITVKPMYLEEQSSPGENHFVWAYHVLIENTGQRTVRLLSRHWKMTDSLGRLQEVRCDLAALVDDLVAGLGQRGAADGEGA